MKYTNGKTSDVSSFPFKSTGESPNKYKSFDLGRAAKGAAAGASFGLPGILIGGVLGGIVMKDEAKQEVANSNLSDDAKNEIVAEHVSEGRATNDQTNI